jgi:predicted peptidase
LTFLHGAGERGNDGSKHLCHVIKDLFNQDNKELYKTIILIPQCPEGQQWVDTPWAEGGYRVSSVPESNENKAVLEILDSLEAKYSINKSRLYLCGISMGGFGVWDLMMRHDERFAAMLAICGGADTIRAERLKDKPIYAVHCYNDGTVPYEGTKEMVDAIKNRGGTSIIFETPDREGKNYGGHVGAWQYASRQPQILSWLLSQTL